MDPDAALRDILEWAYDTANDENNGIDPWDIAETVIGLDQWIRKGGFLPQPWEAGRYLEVVQDD